MSCVPPAHRDWAGLRALLKFVVDPGCLLIYIPAPHGDQMPHLLDFDRRHRRTHRPQRSLSQLRVEVHHPGQPRRRVPNPPPWRDPRQGAGAQGLTGAANQGAGAQEEAASQAQHERQRAARRHDRSRHRLHRCNHRLHDPWGRRAPRCQAGSSSCEHQSEPANRPRSADLISEWLAGNPSPPASRTDG